MRFSIGLVLVAVSAAILLAALLFAIFAIANPPIIGGPSL